MDRGGVEPSIEQTGTLEKRLNRSGNLSRDIEKTQKFSID